jgi:ATP-binding cassette, subfamily F, member 3
VNGAGKSTLIKLLAADEPLTRGEYVLGYNATPDYFAQDQYKALDPEAKLLDDLSTVSNGKTVTELRSLLGCFLFSEDDVFKPIGVLSGGERNRYALARMLLNPSNFLLLDEPTNHLDLRAKDVLLESLQKFSGTVVFVSHDRYFIDRLATKVFEIAGGEVRVYPGNYEDYLWTKQREAEGAAVDAAAAAEAEAAAELAAAAELPKAAKRLNPIKLKQMEDRLAALEAESARLEGEIAELEGALQNFVNAAETARQMGLLDEKRGRLAAALGEWEALSVEIEGA